MIFVMISIDPIKGSSLNIIDLVLNQKKYD